MLQSLPKVTILQKLTLPEITREETELTDCESKGSFSDSCSEEGEWRLDNSSEDGGSDPVNASHLNSRLGHLYLEYFEKITPYDRLPLKDKVR